MGNGFKILTPNRSIFFFIVLIQLVIYECKGLPFGTTRNPHWNVTRDWKRELADKEGYFTNTWAVEVDHPEEEAYVQDISQKHGFTIIGKIGNLKGHYHLRHDEVDELNKRHNREKTDRLLLEDKVHGIVNGIKHYNPVELHLTVRWAEQQKILHRTRRDGIPVDPKFKDMWYMMNTGQTGGPVGVDINVVSVWQKGITGRGVVVSVLDDGMDHNHPDLLPNYEPKASHDFNDNDPDPSPRDIDPDNCHGTRCAGEIAAAANNSICGVGVAYNARIGGVRMLDGKATDALEASSLGFQNNYIDVYSNCWGPKDDGKTFGKPGPLAAKALKLGAENGRGGKGSVFVWATGNGGLTDDDCNCDGYTTSIYTVSIGCIGDHGLSAYYTELCSSTLAVTFNGGAHREREENKMITTDLHHQCTEQFKGTSSAAPLAAGMVALMLEVNPSLTWRDVQHIVVNTAKLTSPVDDGWRTNGAGLHFNHKFGFGRLDADAMVEKAKIWQNIGQQRTCTGAASGEERDIPAGGSLDINIPTQACKCTVAEICKLEHVVLTVSFIHRRRGDLSLLLTSPSGTKNEMLSTRRYDDSKEGLDKWSFMTVHCWGENPVGIWTLKVIDNPLNEIGDRVVNGFGTLHLDTSKQDTDVEDLEEQVIDDQTKQQAARIQSIKVTNPMFDFPYPPGVRRDNVKRFGDNEDTAEAEENIVDDLYNLTQSDTASLTETVYDRSKIPIPRHPQVKNNKRGSDLTENNHDTGSEIADAVEYPGSGDNGSGVFILQKPSQRRQNDLKNDKKRSKIHSKKHSVGKNSKGKYKKDATKKVQVAVEETGTQRVQVNAGYDNPDISCLSNGCSGIMLRWVLTFYGTCD